MSNAGAPPAVARCPPSWASRCGRWLEQNRLMAGALLTVVTLLVYSGAMANGFASDDHLQILQNPLVLNLHHWTHIFTNSVWSFRDPGKRVDFYRPLQIFSYWLVYRFAGPNPAAYHLIQLLLYCSTVVLVWRLGRELLVCELTAFVGALLWAVHPLHVEAVAWIACWPEVGFAFFYLLGFLLFLRAEHGMRNHVAKHCLAALAYFPALFFKESAVGFPIMILAYWYFQNSKWRWRNCCVRLAPYAAAITTSVLVRRVELGYFVPATRPAIASGITDTAALGLLGQHARLFFWPVNLSFARTFDLAASVHSLWPWITLFGVIMAFVGRKREPKLGFLISWWAIALMPCLNIHYLSVPILAERFSYLPSVGLCLAISYLFLERLPQSFQRFENLRYALPVPAVILCLWMVQTVRSIPAWRDDSTLAATSLKHSPRSASMHLARANSIELQPGQSEAAADEFKQAMQLNTESLSPLASIPYDAYLGLGRIAQRERKSGMAVGYFRMAAHILPNASPAYHALGASYFPRRDYATAACYFVQAVQRNPDDLIGRFFLGTCWMKLGKYREAAEEFASAAAADPTYREAYEAEVRALEAAGDWAGAAHVRNSLASVK